MMKEFFMLTCQRQSYTTLVDVFFRGPPPYYRWLASFCASRVRSPGRPDWQRSRQRTARAASPAGLLSGAHAH